MPNTCRVKNNLQQYSGNGQLCFGQGTVSKAFVLPWRQKKCFMTAMQKQTQRAVWAQETIMYQPLALANLHSNNGNRVAGFTYVDQFMQSYAIAVWFFSQRFVVFYRPILATGGPSSNDMRLDISHIMRYE